MCTTASTCGDRSRLQRHRVVTQRQTRTTECRHVVDWIQEGVGLFRPDDGDKVHVVSIAGSIGIIVPCSIPMMTRFVMRPNSAKRLCASSCRMPESATMTDCINNGLLLSRTVSCPIVSLAQRTAPLLGFSAQGDSYGPQHRSGPWNCNAPPHHRQHTRSRVATSVA